MVLIRIEYKIHVSPSTTVRSSQPDLVSNMMSKVLIVALVAAYVSATTVPLKGLPSRMHQLAQAGALEDTLFAYQVKKALALASNESQPQTDQYNVSFQSYSEGILKI